MLNPSSGKETSRRLGTQDDDVLCTCCGFAPGTLLQTKPYTRREVSAGTGTVAGRRVGRGSTRREQLTLQVAPALSCWGCSRTSLAQ